MIRTDKHRTPRRRLRGAFKSRHPFVRLGIEPLEQRALLAADFGDAPKPYPTLLAENGAQHVEAGPTLGATRDVEADGVHSAAADGDGADEDGVTFGTIQVGALDAAITVNVQGGEAKLDAWIDFNGDGSWGGPGEQVFASQSVVVGDNPLTFAVPSWAKAGQSFARFRLSTAGELGVVGSAADGEVEDYALTIVPAAAGSGTFSDQQLVTTTADALFSSFAADVDSDGDMDLLSASANDDKVAWYENDGSQNFTPHTITMAADFACSVTAADLDGDGDMDVLSASLNDDTIAWYENDGSQNFTPHAISTTANGARSVAVVDLDRDGDLDVLSASFNNSTIAWHENNGAQSFTAHVISTTASGAWCVAAADVDSDGDLDVVSASFMDNKIAWYQNNGSQSFTARNVTTAASGAISVFAADVDRDGDMDLLSASNDNHTIAWYDNNGSEKFTARTIASNAFGARSVFASDLDGDGDVDVLSASFHDNKIAWYANNGSQSFTPHIISRSANGAFSVLAADIDGDGDLDVVSGSLKDDKIAWYAQNGLPAITANNGVTVGEGESAQLGAAQLSATDSDNPPDQLVYTLVTPPSVGWLQRSGIPGSRITTFTQADINAGLIRYRHEGSETVSDSFTFTISDGVGGVTAPLLFTITVTPADGAPQLDNTLSPALHSTAEDALIPASTQVASLLSGAVTDPDAGALRGIAVTAASNYHGTWQFSLDDGTTWIGMSEPSQSAARLLPGWSRVRFVPNADFNGTVKLYYRAWDQTQGTVGGTLNTVTHIGGDNSMSFATESASLTVTPVNDPPALVLGGAIGYTHDAAAITLASAATVTDIDSVNFDGGRLRVRITDGASSANRLLIGAGFAVDANNNVLQGATIIGRRTANGFGTNELIVLFNTSATPTVAQQLVRAIQFKTVGGAVGPCKVIFTVSDGDGGTSGEAEKTVNVL
jgi:hypothetical protein